MKCGDAHIGRNIRMWPSGREYGPSQTWLSDGGWTLKSDHLDTLLLFFIIEDIVESKLNL